MNELRIRDRGVTAPTRDDNELLRRRSELAASWRRSIAALGSPERVTAIPPAPAPGPDMSLLRELADPITRLSRDLAGTGLGVLLADPAGGIIERWCADAQSERHFRTVGTEPGVSLSEAAVGTNGVGTVAATGRAVQVFGDEHFAPFFTSALCTGAPLRRSADGALVGIVTLSCDLTPRPDLLRALLGQFMRQLTAQLEPHLRELRPVMLTVADHSSSHRSSPSPEAPAPRSARQVPSMPAPPIRMAGRSPAWLAAVRALERSSQLIQPVLLVGELGVGKTVLASSVALEARPAPLVVDCAERHVHGTRLWLQRLARALSQEQGVVLRGVEKLTESATQGLTALLAGSAAAGPVRLTAQAESPTTRTSLQWRLGARTIWVPPLRERVADLPELWRVLTDERAPGTALRLGPDALAALQEHPWPGNVLELRQLVDRLAAEGRTGLVRADDLKLTSSPPRLTMIERLERDGLRSALAQAEGHRGKAADILGVSRATVYRKIKRYHLEQESIATAITLSV